MMVAVTVMALTMASCTPDDPVQPVTDEPVVEPTQTAWTPEGKSWRAIVVDDYLEWHFEDEFTYTFFTADSGVLHRRAIIVAGRTIREDEQSDWEYDFPFHYTVENKMVYVAFESGRNKNLYYNERSNTLVTSEGYDRVVYHQVTD